MLSFTELPQSVIKELGLYVKINTPNILEYDFIDIAQKNESYNTHLIWCDTSSWHIAHDIHVFKTSDKFEWCYYSADQIFSLEDAITQLKYLKSKYMETFKRYKECQQNKRLTKLSEDFND